MRESDQERNEEMAPAGEQTPPEEDLPQDDCPTGVFEPVSQSAATAIAVEEPAEEPAPEEEPAPQEPLWEEKPKRDLHNLWLALKIVKWVFFVLLTVALIAGFAVGYLTITEYRPAYSENPERGNYNTDQAVPARTLRILTLNTGYGALGREADFFMDGGKSVNPASEELVRENMLGIESMLRSADADILLLQEVDTGSKRSFQINQWRQYEYDLGNYESRYALNYSCRYVPYPLPTIGEVHSGLATFSRFDIASATRYSLPCPFEWPERVANLKRCLLVTRLPIEGKSEETKKQELVIVNLHLEAYDDGEGKEAQTQLLLQILQEEYEKGNYVVAGGDFNQYFPGTQQRYPLKETSNWVPGVLGELPAGWSYAYDASTPTCRLLNQPLDETSSLTQYYVIDGFIVSPNVNVVSVRTGNEGFGFTDHNPVLLEIELQ